MNRPKPTAEIIIKTYKYTDNMLIIACSTERAKAWITSEAPTFGTLTSINNAEYHLYVHAFYDIVEVGAYLKEGMPL